MKKLTQVIAITAVTAAITVMSGGISEAGPRKMQVKPTPSVYPKPPTNKTIQIPSRETANILRLTLDCKKKDGVLEKYPKYNAFGQLIGYTYKCILLY